MSRIKTKNSIWIAILVSALISSCSTTYHKRKFKKFKPKQSQNNLAQKDGYYFYETKVTRYDNFVASDEGGYKPLDSVTNTAVTGMLFYDSGKVYVMKGGLFDGLEHTKKNSLQVALSNLEQRIDEFQLKTINTKNTNISVLGKYGIHQDTITIQYHRFSYGDKYLTELKGIFNAPDSFTLFQRIDFETSLLAKVKPKTIRKTYNFKRY